MELSKKISNFYEPWPCGNTIIVVVLIILGVRGKSLFINKICESSSNSIHPSIHSLKSLNDFIYFACVYRNRSFTTGLTNSVHSPWLWTKKVKVFSGGGQLHAHNIHHTLSLAWPLGGGDGGAGWPINDYDLAKLTACPHTHTQQTMAISQSSRGASLENEIDK